MKKYLFLLLSFQGFAQESNVFENLIVRSNILKKEMKFALYLPAGYETSDRRYPVTYLLHGGGGNHTDWIQLGNMQQIVDKGTREGSMAPMIVVMPDAEMTYYMNNAQGNYQYEDYFIKELLPHIEKNYKVRAGKDNRALAGLSMGGFGSLLYALHHPELFAACSAMSAGVRTDEEINQMTQPEFLRRYRSALGEVKEGEKRITDFWNQNSILYLLQHLPEAQKKAVRFWLDCGDDDELLFRGNALLHIALREQKVPHEFRMRNGGHTWEYWRTGLPDALGFVSRSFWQN